MGEQGLEQEVVWPRLMPRAAAISLWVRWGVLYQQAQDAKVGVLVVVGAIGHGRIAGVEGRGQAVEGQGAGRLPPCRVMFGHR